MAAVLVEAAGGEIRVPLSLIDQARFIHLHQSNHESGYVIYSTKPYSRSAGGPIIDGTAAVIDNPKNLKGPTE